MRVRSRLAVARSVEPYDLQLALSKMKTELADRFASLFALHWPEEAAELASRSAFEELIDSTAAALSDVLQRLHRRMTWARSTLTSIAVAIGSVP